MNLSTWKLSISKLLGAVSFGLIDDIENIGQTVDQQFQIIRVKIIVIGPPIIIIIIPSIIV